MAGGEDGGRRWRFRVTKLRVGDVRLLLVGLHGWGIGEGRWVGWDGWFGTAESKACDLPEDGTDESYSFDTSFAIEEMGYFDTSIKFHDGSRFPVPE